MRWTYVLNCLEKNTKILLSCYYLLGITQRKLGDFKAALQSLQRALDIGIKLFGEEHQSTADPYHLVHAVLSPVKVISKHLFKIISVPCAYVLNCSEKIMKALLPVTGK